MATGVQTNAVTPQSSLQARSLGPWMNDAPLAMEPGLDGVYPESYLIGAGGIFRGLGALGSTAKGTTSLYRAVGPTELANINKTGALTNIAGIEGKYFTTSAADASAYAKQAVRAFGDAPYTTIQTQVPNGLLKGLSPATVDGGIPAWVLPTDRLKNLVPNVVDHMSLPPPGF